MATDHPFERAGLGIAPFRFVGMEEKTYQSHPDAPVQPGGSCQFCGTGIRYAFWVRSSDGRQFYVGCECIRKAERPGSPLLAAADQAERNLKRTLAKEARARRDARDWEQVKLFNAEVDASLGRQMVDISHPVKWQADKGRNLLDYWQWMFTHAGLAGRKQAMAQVRRYLAEDA